MIRRTAHRLANGLRKIGQGLPLRGENVWPGVPTDLFVAHLSIYQFFLRWCRQKTVLDVGSGNGYGSAYLAGEGAVQVLGIDLDPRSVRYAQRRYQAPNLHFEPADCRRYDPGDRAFDRIVSSNTLEHLDDPHEFFRSVEDWRHPVSEMIVVVPPITSEALLAENLRNPYHQSPLTVDQWLEVFSRCGWIPRLYRHTHPAHDQLDFSSPFPSVFRAEEFEFLPTDRDGFYREPTLSAVFHLER